MSVVSGKQAEDYVADFLIENKYKILARNWRTPVCELDIIASRGNRLYIIEVKYRKTLFQGGGYEYINKAKIRKLKLGFEIWRLQNKWSGEALLLAASVLGYPPEIVLVEIRT